LKSHKLKPWRIHHWLSSKVAMDEAFRSTVLDVLDLYTRLLGPDEEVWSVDEKPSLQPRTRSADTRPAQPGGTPIYVEHEYERKGALQLFAAFNTRTGKVIGQLQLRKRQQEFLQLLEAIDEQAPSEVKTIHVVADNASIHKGKLVRAWLSRHPRVRMHFTPVHCSWMNQVEQWFSILQRKRLTAPNFADLAVLEERVLAFVAEWNLHAHPFKWTTKSFDKVIAKIDATLSAVA
jgi:transposase